jgi:hypothetical protein
MWAKSLLLSAFFAASAVSSTVDASPRTPAFQPQTLIPVQDRRNSAQLRPMPEVISELQSRYGGEYLGYRLEDGPRPIYVVRWRMPDGQVRDIRVNAAR